MRDIKFCGLLKNHFKVGDEKVNECRGEAVIKSPCK